MSWDLAKSALKWVASIHSERDGTGSASRVCLLLICLTVCGVLIAHLWLQRSLPDASTLGGLSGLLTAGAAGYGANKIVSKQ